jgi:uncharacterized membrane protein
MKPVTDIDGPEDEISNYRSFPLYGILACGIILFCIGLYLALTEQFAYGNLKSGAYWQEPEQKQFVSGWYILFFGIAISIFPVVRLIKESNKRRKQKSQE